MSWQHVWTLFKVREVSSIPVHTSGPRGKTVQMPVKVQGELGFSSNTRTWEDNYIRPDSILDKVRRGEELQRSGR